MIHFSASTHPTNTSYPSYPSHLSYSPPPSSIPFTITSISLFHYTLPILFWRAYSPPDIIIITKSNDALALVAPSQQSRPKQNPHENHRTSPLKIRLEGLPDPQLTLPQPLRLRRPRHRPHPLRTPQTTLQYTRLNQTLPHCKKNTYTNSPTSTSGRRN